MGLFKKKHDPIAERERVLQAELAQVQNQIKQLNSKLREPAHAPRYRSTTLPDGELSRSSATKRPVPPEPIFESWEPRHARALELPGTQAHYNDLGLRKYDLPALWRRLCHHFQGPPAGNPKLVNYLAAGGIKGLRPLRYEKRVARNRVLALFALLLLMLWGVVALFVGQ